MLGDWIHSALSKVGITSERVERWLGKPCNCRERQEKLNQLSLLLKRFLSGKVKDVAKHIDSLTREEP